MSREIRTQKKQAGSGEATFGQQDDSFGIGFYNCRSGVAALLDPAYLFHQISHRAAHGLADVHVGFGVAVVVASRCAAL